MSRDNAVHFREKKKRREKDWHNAIQSVGSSGYLVAAGPRPESARRQVPVPHLCSRTGQR